MIQVAQLKMLAYKNCSETCYPVYEGANTSSIVVVNF